MGLSGLLFDMLCNGSFRELRSSQISPSEQGPE
jgi:hypothetical protein